MVLYYLLTGSSDIKELPKKVSDRSLRAIINHAANYEVSTRYKTVAKLRRALQKHSKGTSYRPLYSVLFAATLVLCIVAGVFILPILSESISTHLRADMPQIHQFADPVIEQAIRLALGKTADEPVYAHELLGVEGIYIAGDRAFNTSNELNDYTKSIAENGVKPPLYSMLLSTSDIAACKNLKKLYISYNAIETIDFLDENHSLREIHLGYTSVSNIETIREFPMLTTLGLNDCPVIDLSPIKNCKTLTTLWLNTCPVSDLTPLQDCPTLDHIDLVNLNVDNYDFAISGKHYSNITIANAPYERFMTNLSGITVSRLTLISCGITKFDVFPDMAITETLDIRYNNLINTDGSERILADGANIVK
jgi:hypothetical protein